MIEIGIAERKVTKIKIYVIGIKYYSKKIMICVRVKIYLDMTRIIVANKLVSLQDTVQVTTQ